MNYPVVSAGLVMGPRGIGTMGAMLIVGRLVGRVDTRLLLAIGLTLTAWPFQAMTGWTPDVSQETIIGVGIIQGMGLGFLTVPLTVVALSTLSPERRTEGAGLLQPVTQHRIERRHLRGEQSADPEHADKPTPASPRPFTAVNRAFENPMIAQFWDPATAAGRAALDAVITRQPRSLLISTITNC